MIHDDGKLTEPVDEREEGCVKLGGLHSAFHSR